MPQRRPKSTILGADLLGQGHAAEAERIARHAVRVLERGGQQPSAEGLTTQGVALAQSGTTSRQSAVGTRNRVAETVGDLEAPVARASIIEGIHSQDSAQNDNYVPIGNRSVESSQHPETGQRLINCADALFHTLNIWTLRLRSRRNTLGETSLFKQHVEESEENGDRTSIARCWRFSHKGAHLLGFKHHQSSSPCSIPTQGTIRREQLFADEGVTFFRGLRKPKGRLLKNRRNPRVTDLNSAR